MLRLLAALALAAAWRPPSPRVAPRLPSARAAAVLDRVEADAGEGVQYGETSGAALLFEGVFDDPKFPCAHGGSAAYSIAITEFSVAAAAAR